MLHMMTYIKKVWFLKIHLHSRLAFIPQFYKLRIEPNGGIQGGSTLAQYNF